MKKVLLINDMPGYGKVALSAMVPILSYLDIETYSLPTALVSNTLDYGKFEILETTDYIRKTLAVWDQIGFRFDAVSTGFILSEKQAHFVAEYCRQQREKGVRVYTDPIMADYGRLYNGVTEAAVSGMRRLASAADVILPNYTEACFLADLSYSEEPAGREAVCTLIEKLRALGCGSVVITSLPLEGRKFVCGYDGENQETFFLPYREIPGRFPGTGDIFSAVMIGRHLNGSSLKDSVRAAMTTVEKMIMQNLDSGRKYIPVESFLGLLPPAADTQQENRDITDSREQKEIE